MARTLRIATRESKLAMWQANYVKDALEKAHADLSVEIIGMTTQGDRDKNTYTDHPPSSETWCKRGVNVV